MIGAPNEQGVAIEIRYGFEIAPLGDLVGKTTMRELFAILASSGMVIGADSGPMHVAAALGRRVISLWGPTDPVRTGPYGNEDLIVQSKVPCAGCYRRVCPGLDNVCMSSISAEDVMLKVDKVVAECNRNSQ